MITLRPAHERGHADHGWLDTWHTFSFADYRDPRHMGYRTLRVINDDRVAPGRGFGTHPHADMEIVTYVLSGQLQHRDSMGTGSIITPGEVQRMTAGTGVTHSEVNPSRSEPLHLLQIWILPEQRRLPPGYQQKRFPEAERLGRLRLVASRDGRDGSVTIHQDAALWAGLLNAGERAVHELVPGRGAWVHVARGQVELNGHHLGPGDGAAVEQEPVSIAGIDHGEILLFDLA
jgi:quercetin 2,3-dioxygenase